MTAVRPQGVRIRKADGQVIPCEPAYRGRNADGVDVWGLDTELNLGAGDRLLVAMMPARSALEMPTADGADVLPRVRVRTDWRARVGRWWRETVAPLLWLYVACLLVGAALGALIVHGGMA